VPTRARNNSTSIEVTTRRDRACKGDVEVEASTDTSPSSISARALDLPSISMSKASSVRMSMSVADSTGAVDAISCSPATRDSFTSELDVSTRSDLSSHRPPVTLPTSPLPGTVTEIGAVLTKPAPTPGAVAAISLRDGTSKPGRNDAWEDSNARGRPPASTNRKFKL
jgi:hypothetical protein